MNCCSILLREHSRTFRKLLFSLTVVRSMGGGPRTFPGGLNKWQWKRLHEKKAREKEKRLLDQEKQLYQARIRSQIRAKLAGQSGTDLHSGRNHGPMTPQDQIKALADRFMKAGAEDLWNEADGPVESPPPPSPSPSNNHLVRTRVSDRNLNSGNERTVDSMNLNDPQRSQHHLAYNLRATRSSINFPRNDTSDGEEDSDSESGFDEARHR